MNRSERITLSDFVASCGGLLGLFMGISVLSIVEMVYFLTLRLGCKLRREMKIRDSEITWAKSNGLNTNAFN